MASFKAGDRVQLASREVNAEDEKNGLYYSYFGELTGAVDTVYDDGSVCIDVDLESLSQEARGRHLAMQEAERKRWLEALSGEARNRLTPEQKQLKLSYKILASKNDLEPFKGGKPGSTKRSADTEQAGKEDASSAATKRPSEDDLAKAEEDYLKSLQEKT